MDKLLRTYYLGRITELEIEEDNHHKLCKSFHIDVLEENKRALNRN